MPLKWKRDVWVVVAALLVGAPAAAQLPGLGPLPTPSFPQLPVASPLIEAVDPGRLADVRRLKLETLVRRHPRELETDERGAVVVRSQVLAISPSPEALARARAEGFVIAKEEALEAVDLVMVVLTAPPGMSARQAVKRMRRIDPKGQYDFNHLYSDAGGIAAGAERSAALARSGRGSTVRIGLVDTGVDTDHPVFAGARVEQRPFASGGLKPAPHGTAAASLIVGRSGPFRGGAAGATLLVADVYGSGPTGGSADAIARGLQWLAQSDVRVVNVSLVGPPNLILKAAVRGLAARGVIVVAAVGNDGPAAPPLYPAAWPEVVAVTAVDGRDRVLLEAGQGGHVDFAAPGADMAAAAPGGRFAAVRGTSFAAPIVAGLIADLLASRDGAAAVEALGRDARDLGARGMDPIYGRGLVGVSQRVSPGALGVRK